MRRTDTEQTGLHVCLHFRAGESGFGHSSPLTGVCV